MQKKRPKPKQTKNQVLIRSSSSINLSQQRLPAALGLGGSAHPLTAGCPPSHTLPPPASGLGGQGGDLQHFLIKLIYVRKFQMSALRSAKAVGEKGKNKHMGHLPAGQPCRAVWGLGVGQGTWLMQPWCAWGRLSSHCCAEPSSPTPHWARPRWDGHRSPGWDGHTSPGWHGHAAREDSTNWGSVC